MQTVWVTTKSGLKFSQDDVAEVRLVKVRQEDETPSIFRSKQETKLPHIEVRLKKSHWSALSEFTRRNLNRYIAIVIDGEVVFAPYIATPIEHGFLRMHIAVTLPELEVTAKKFKSEIVIVEEATPQP